jgi:hypothetical protein
VRRGSALLLGTFWLACAPPERPPCDATPAPGLVGSICGFDHPEDLELVPAAGVVLASGLEPGAGLWAIDVEGLAGADAQPWRIWPGQGAGSTASVSGDPACTTPPDPAAFLAHGLTARADSATSHVTLAVVGHGAREAIELFELHGKGRSTFATWRGCVPLPPDAMGNDVGIAPDGEIVVTKFIPYREGLALRYEALRASVGFESGEVLAWSRERGWRAVPGTQGAGPNGMVLSADGEFIYFAENGRQRIVRVPRAGASAERPAAFAALPSNVDNINWGNGRLLAVVHLGGAQALFQACLMHWAVFEVDPDSLEAREILDHEGEVLCGATSAVQVGHRYLIGSMNETRVGVWQPAS